MSAAEVLHRLEKVGVRIAPTPDGKLDLEGPPMPEGERQRIVSMVREYKPALLALLRGPQSGDVLFHMEDGTPFILEESYDHIARPCSSCGAFMARSKEATDAEWAVARWCGACRGNYIQ